VRGLRWLKERNFFNFSASSNNQTAIEPYIGQLRPRHTLFSVIVSLFLVAVNLMLLIEGEMAKAEPFSMRGE
jgi:hypothetical protein